jgi:adenylate cyclase, class 2
MGGSADPPLLRMALEREIKLRFDTADDARERILAIGATPLRGRRLQDDALLDTADELLRGRRSVLRVRNDGGRSLLTFKGPPQPGAMKLREEHETAVADGEVLVTILQSLALRTWFRYQKYREEYASADVVIAIDETPIGVFVEIEGSEALIHDTARALGRGPDDYITDSYRMLFLRHCDAEGGPATDMLFAEPSSE